jgi:cytoskeletal protein CcmA (bactofilin family)
VAGYTRQSSADIIATAVVRANPLNVEYNAIRDAFNASTGHKHDGTTAEGAYVPLIADSDALNKVAIDTTNNRVGVFVEVSSAAVEQIRIQDGAIVPVTTNDIDLGTSSLKFKNLFLEGTSTIEVLEVANNTTLTGNLTVNGNTTLGNAASDTVTVTADVASPLLPSADDTYDLGAVGSEWRNLYIDGTATIDALVADTADINGGSIDGAVIGGASAAAITGTTITGTSFVIGSADINEAELETIDGVTAGTVAASKAIVVDSNKDFTGARNVTITGELDAATLDVSGDVDIDGTLETDALSIASTAVTSTAAELNIVDGDTSASAITLADADRVIINDNGTMKQVAITNLTTYLGGNLGILSSVTAVGALDSGSITSGFGAINNGSSTITTTGNITGGNIIIGDGGNIGSASDTDAVSIAAGGNVTVSQDLIVSGNLTVSGTQTVVDTVTINAQNAIVFEGATPDDHETTLTIVDPTADRTINLPNQSGTVPVLAAASNTAITATPAELNIIDGGTSATSTTVADADRVVMNDDGTMVQVAVTDLAAYFDDEITAMPNLVTTAATTVGALNSGSITSGFGAIDNGSSAITTTGTITGGTVSFGSITDGAITATAFVDEDNMSSNSATLIPTQQSVKAYVDSVAGTSNNVTGLNATGAELNTVADFSAVSVDTSTAIANNDALLVFDNGNNIGYRDVDLLDTYFSATSKTLTNKTLTSPIVTGMHLNDSGFTVEGSGADGNETTVAFTNPTADHTITFPNATGTVALSNSSSATFGGNGSSGGVTLQDGLVSIRTGTGSVAAIRFYCESSNAHYTELKSAAHSAYSGNLSFVLPAADGSSGQFLKTDGSGALSFAAANNYVHPNHSGEVTSTADGATVVADNVIDEANLKVSNSPSNGYVLTAQSGNTGGLTWAEAASGAPLYAANESSPNAQPSALGNNAIAIGNTTKAGTQASHANAIAIGGSDTTSQPVQATNTHAVAIGTSYAGEVTASGDGSMAIGTGATVASSGGALALGRNATASGGSSVSMGRGSAASALYAAALGYNAVAAGSSSMALVNSRAGSSGAFAAGIDNNTSSYGATGQNSVALGYQSKASGQRAFSVGSGADASGTQAIALGGNTASGAYSLTAGGEAGTLTASGAYSATIGGSVNTSSGEASYAFGKRALAAQDGKYAYGAQLVSTTGATQGGMMILVAATTDATATILRSDTNSADADNQIVAASDTAITFDGSVTGIQNGAQAFASFLISGLLVNDGGTTTLVNSATTVIDNQSSWTVAMSADNTNNALAITVTGEASHNIRWVANIRTSEVTYA